MELTYELLRADINGELQAVAGFYEQTSGRDGAFWIAPPGLSRVLGQTLGEGDGATTRFPLTRALLGYIEPVQATSGVSAVYLAGVAQAAGWSVTAGFYPAIEFATAPAAGASVAADFDALQLCRFAEDVADFENFMALLWRWGSVRLQTVRP